VALREREKALTSVILEKGGEVSRSLLAGGKVKRDIPGGKAWDGKGGGTSSRILGTGSHARGAGASAQVHLLNGAKTAAD